jgi:protein-tyrosine phosphatase
MDQSNYRDVMSLARNEEDRRKVSLFLNISAPGKNKAVPDPWYGGEEGFQQVFDLVHHTCCILVDQLKSQK